jgi:hypothetical protein
MLQVTSLSSLGRLTDLMFRRREGYFGDGNSQLSHLASSMHQRALLFVIICTEQERAYKPKPPANEVVGGRMSLMGKFSVIRLPSWKMTTRLTSNSIYETRCISDTNNKSQRRQASTLKVRVWTVWQVNSLGKTMCSCRGMLRGMSPSAIWMF